MEYVQIKDGCWTDNKKDKVLQIIINATIIKAVSFLEFCIEQQQKKGNEIEEMGELHTFVSSPQKNSFPEICL